MFTGLVACLGEVTARRDGLGETRFTITPKIPFPTPCPGESIAVNGACLTAESFGNKTFTAYASPETLACTTLASLRIGSPVNLERAVAAGDRLGGHIVSGHVDCLAHILTITPKGMAKELRIAFPPAFAHLMVPKGSVALDGISLTINECGIDFFTVSIIPETQAATTIHFWQPGRALNMETDIIGKYVARMAELGYPKTNPNHAEKKRELTLDSLRENGF